MIQSTMIYKILHFSILFIEYIHSHSILFYYLYNHLYITMESESMGLFI